MRVFVKPSFNTLGDFEKTLTVLSQNNIYYIVMNIVDKISNLTFFFFFLGTEVTDLYDLWFHVKFSFKK